MYTKIPWKDFQRAQYPDAGKEIIFTTINKPNKVMAGTYNDLFVIVGLIDTHQAVKTMAHNKFVEKLRRFHASTLKFWIYFSDLENLKTDENG